ncbi:MAG: c-type cytochrome [Gemmatimonadota bacterium]|nr:cytochrome c [Gemmatimonadota bacterium]
MRVPPYLLRPMLLLAAACLALGARPARAQEVRAPYTEQQAVVGEAYFRGYCLECHGAADMANESFKAKWHGRPAFDLFERLRTSMPDGAPGSLPRQTYADIVAYFLKLNGVPVGAMPLGADSLVLSRVRLELRASATTPSTR